MPVLYMAGRAGAVGCGGSAGPMGDDGADEKLDEAFSDWKKAHGLTGIRQRDTIRLPDEEVPRSLGAKAKNYRIYDPETGENYTIKEGTRVQNREVLRGMVCPSRCLRALRRA